MSEEKAQLLMIRGALLEMPQDEQDKVESYRLRFREILEEDGAGDEALMAFGIVGLEKQVELQ